MKKKSTIKTLLAMGILGLFLLPSLASADEATARKLINSQGCKGCHKIEGSGGSIGPDLDHVGSQLSAEAIKHQLLDPKANNPNSIMPSMAHLSGDDINALVEFLSGLK